MYILRNVPIFRNTARKVLGLQLHITAGSHRIYNENNYKGADRSLARPD